MEGVNENIFKGFRERMQSDFYQSSVECVDEASRIDVLKLREDIREKLKRHGTDVDKNDADPTGDGDQSPIHLDHDGKQVFRDLFASGGDMASLIEEYNMRNLWYLSMFSKHCLEGSIDVVKTIIQKVENQPPEELIKLLEERETAMRLSPLMLIASFGKCRTGSSEVLKNQIKAAKLLLFHGARPDAKDVCGKTVFHYGAGFAATVTTMKIAKMCMEAAESCHLFGKEVELNGLKTATFNGKRGICRGYDVDTGRRAVYISDERKKMALKPENIRLVKGKTGSKRPKLCDSQDRLGGTCLLEVSLMSNRTDVATFLLEECGASIDIADFDGYSPKSMALTPGAQASCSVAPLLAKAAMISERKQRKEAEAMKMKSCGNCGAVHSGTRLFSICSHCKAVAYCSKECQSQDWKAGHKKVCKEMDATITLKRPTAECGQSMNFRTGKVSSGSYRKPGHVAVDERFYVKVQGETEIMPLLIYDKSRECEFDYAPDHPGFRKILAKVQADPACNGRKTYMNASFDAVGNCKLYPGQTTTKSW